LENVAGLAYPTEGRAPYAALVVGQLAEMGYDSRWGIVGARDAGASHRRDRWFCLAYSGREEQRGRETLRATQDGLGESERTHKESSGRGESPSGFRPEREPSDGCTAAVGNPESTGGIFPPGPSDTERWGAILAERPDLAPSVESPLRRMVDGPRSWLDRHRRRRLAALANGVVPAQAALAWALLEDTA
jgi:DNA (cytosine-5)-methyltransferase 1